jgi:hypothetical protein
MAAQEYFNAGWSSQHHAYNAPLPPLPPGEGSSSGPTNIATPTSSSSSPFDDHSYVYPSHAQDSQQSLGVDTEYYGRNGKPHVQDQYADDIPLKTQQQPNPYGPGSEEQLPGPLGATGEGKRKKRSKQKKRIPWFVYAITTIQIAVFISELVKNSMSLQFNFLALYSDGHAPKFQPHTDSHCSSHIDQVSNRNPPSVQSHDWAFTLPPY